MLSRGQFSLTGIFHWEVWTPDMGYCRLRGTAKNGIVNVGLNTLLDSFFRNTAPPAAWYMGLIGATSFTTGLAAADTMASHAGWVEDQSYSQATRPQWSPAAAASQVLINSTKFTFSMNALKTIKGFFVASDSTKGGSSGTLWSTGLFDADLQLASGENLLGQYQLTAAAGV